MVITCNALSTASGIECHCTVDCRCEAGYVPPEAGRGAPLTTAADVYQFGGVCYFMAMGCDPPYPCEGGEDLSAGMLLFLFDDC